MSRAFLIAIAFATFLAGAPAQGWGASLIAKISVSTQTMTVSRHGRVIHTWKVSTARRGYITPRGSWRPKRMHRMWHSRKYDMSPMPYSVFYHGGYAIHGTSAVKRLGTPASHGCVRLATRNAAKFYSLVKQIGPGNTRIIVTN
ncbi:MAG: L,D-transpeptidase [Pseudaminobacter sp.]|nr:L,D-transpeptidase [Pseudaminobacter sp.]